MNLSSSLLNSILLANQGPLKAYDPSLAAGPDPEVFARTFHLQSWTTIRGDASATFAVRSVTQDEGGWLDLSTYADAAFWIDVCGVNNPTTGIVSLTLESSPTKDDNYFKPVAAPLTLVPQAVNGSVTPYLVRTVRTPTTVPLAKYTRWRLSVAGGATGKWDATFRIRGAGGRTSFTLPTQLAGCVGWLRADLGVTLSLGNVTTWADQSGKGNDGAAPAGREPAYDVTGHQINGQPTLFFDPTGGAATAKYLQLPAGAMSPGGSPYPAVHAFVVHRRNAATESNPTRTGFWWFGSGTGEAMPSDVNNHIYDDFGSTTTYDCGGPVVLLNTPHVYEVQAAAGSWANLLNGKAQFSSVTNTVSFSSSLLQIGGNSVLGPNFYYGDIAEVIFYSRILSASERTLLVGYLNGRYGLGAK